MGEMWEIEFLWQHTKAGILNLLLQARLPMNEHSMDGEYDTNLPFYN
jgi:hypothetical protein